MIYVVTTASHRYTHAVVAEALPMVRRMSWPFFLARRSLPRGTYILTDFDRLGFWQLEMAARVHRQLVAAGCRVLNDPGRVPNRLALLRQLHRAGINSFQAWPASDAALVDRFPVFVRTGSAHRGNLTGPIETRAALGGAIEGLLSEGYPLNDLIAIEYRAEPMRDGIFRKLSAYCVSGRIIATPSIAQRHWMVKQGEYLGDDALFEEDLAHVRANGYAEEVARTFAEAGVDYGRADYGIVAGRPEFYEINTNPQVHALAPHRSADRVEAGRHAREAYLEAMRSVDDVGAGGRVRIELPRTLRRRRRWVKLFPGYQWMP